MLEGRPLRRWSPSLMGVAILLDSESDCCVMDEIVLAPEMSLFVSLRSAAVLMFLPAKSEVFSLAVLAGGGIDAEAAPWPW